MDETLKILVNDFVLESQERLERIEELILAIENRDITECDEELNFLKREFHTLKGNSGMMGFKITQQVAHSAEDKILKLKEKTVSIDDVLDDLDTLKKLIEEIKNTGSEENFLNGEKEHQNKESSSDIDHGQIGVRVPFQMLDELVDLLGEMLIFKNRLTDALFKVKSNKYDLNTALSEVDLTQEYLGKILTLLYDKVISLRMVPLSILFRKLKRIVRDESDKEGKKVNLEICGGETPLDKALLEIANEALGHLVRNSIIHGIESPEERIRLGKKEEGMLKINATLESREVIIDVEDDGKGIDEEKVIETAINKGIDLSNFGNVYELLFLPGFTTKENADLSAGRGIGLSAVYEVVQKQGGRIQVTSKKNVGTRFRLRLPLSIAISNALLIEADGEEYAIPLQFIVEIMKYNEESHSINNAEVIKWRDNVIPVIDIGYLARSRDSYREKGFIIIVDCNNKQRGILAEKVIGIRDIVIKKLDSMVGAPEWVAGATIRGDGKTTLILDTKTIVNTKVFK